MVSYGPWTQEPDYEVTTAWTESNRNDTMDGASLDRERHQYAEFSLTATGWFPVEDGSMIAALEVADGAAFLAGRGGSGASNNIGTHLIRGHIAGTFGEENWESGGQVAIEHHPWYTPAGFRSANDVGFIPFYFYPGDGLDDPTPTPENAIGVEFAGDPLGISQWQQVILASSSILKALNLDDSGISVGATTTLTAPASTDVYVQSLADASAMSSSATQLTIVTGSIENDTTTLGADVDVTDHMTDVGAVFFTRTNHFLFPQYDDDYTVIIPSNRWDYGYWFNRVDLRWTLRPPLYRWIYDTVPYRRIGKRGDGRAGGARRVGRQPKTIQGSNRRGAGAIV